MKLNAHDANTSTNLIPKVPRVRGTKPKEQEEYRMFPEDQEEDVNTEESSTPEQEVQEDVNTPETEESSPSENENAQPEEGKNQDAAEALDPSGVPWKNRAMEWQRKSQELAQSLPEIVEKTMQSTLAKHQQQSETREYTIAELEAFAQQKPEYRAWVEDQKAQIIQKNLLKQFDEKLAAKEKQTQVQTVRQQAEAEVVKTFPNMFVKDSQGNVAWNQNDVMTQKVAEYMRDPEFVNNPRGLLIAAKQAYADLAMSGQMQIQKTNKDLKKQVKSLEKKTFIEGGGKSPQPSKPPLRAAQERLAQTGKVKDAQAAVAEIFKLKGWIKE